MERQIKLYSLKRKGAAVPKVNIISTNKLSHEDEASGFKDT